MSRWNDRLSTFARVTRFDYPYQTRASKRPDPLPTLIEFHSAQYESMGTGGARLLIGKSMGSRVGLHVAAEVRKAPVAAICFGYPLVAQSSGKLRDAALVGCPCPVLLIQGTRDPLCPLPLLEKVLKGRTAGTELFVVNAGNHDLISTKAALKERGQTSDESDATIAQVIAKFVATVLENAAEPT